MSCKKRRRSKHHWRLKILLGYRALFRVFKLNNICECTCVHCHSRYWIMSLSYAFVYQNNGFNKCHGKGIGHEGKCRQNVENLQSIMLEYLIKHDAYHTLFSDHLQINSPPALLYRKYASVSWVSIDSDNGLSSDLRQSIIWTNTDIC